MKKTLKTAFIATIPVLTGYVVLGLGFGIILKSAGYGILLAFAMSLLIYAGSMQFVAVSLLTGGASILTAALTTLMVNARHLFYGISMLEKYKGTGKYKPYLIFALTDETYSLVCMDPPDVPSEQRTNYYFFVSLFNQLYWIVGTLIGCFFGSLITFNTEGLDFVMTAMFAVILLEQLQKKQNRPSALLGLGLSLLCLLIFGADAFMIPAMLAILGALILLRPLLEGGASS